MRTRSPAAPSASATWPSRRPWKPSSTGCWLHHNTLLKGLGAETFEKQDLLDRLLAMAPKLLPFSEAVWAAGRSPPQRQARPVRRRARRPAGCRPRHLSVRHQLQHRGRPRRGGLGRGAQPDRLPCWASSRPTPPASAPARSRPSCSTMSASTWASVGREFGTVTGRERRCGWFDACLVRQSVKVERHAGHRPDQAGRAGRPDRP
jgi:adenylosuccinate synthase